MTFVQQTLFNDEEITEDRLRVVCAQYGLELFEGEGPPRVVYYRPKESAFPYKDTQKDIQQLLPDFTTPKVELADNEYTKPIDSMFKGLETGDIEAVIVTIPNAVIDAMLSESTNEKDPLATLKEYLSRDLMIICANVKRKYGNNIKYKYKVISKERIAKEELSTIADNWGKPNETYKPAKVQDGYNLEIELVLKSDTREVTEEMSLTVVKIDDKWYLHPSSVDSFGF